MKRVHIVGCPRSGTTLLMELVSTCFKNAGHCEHELSIFAPVEKLDGVYFTKQPNDIKHLRHIFHADPQLHVIYMGRDPRSVITSQHRASPGEYFCNYRVWRECDDAARRYLDHPRFLRLCYEDLVASPDEVHAQILAQFPFLKQVHLFSEYQQYARPSEASERAMNGLRAINSDSLSKWQNHLPRIKEQLLRHPQLAQDLVRLGYEADNSWQTLLEGVIPETLPCRYPERRPYLKELEKALRIWLKSRRYLKALS